ncbi:class I SAM-dependent methyltransferase [Streptomyces marincola]|uniref:class I SAM-dependent methyltransferase n=1 Tax=Streptomyces marincola TaxID=2878388 RepID=UPI001CF23507|nr:class I SAM-dependent methyltransferase [Streptomyces marincola]UCM86662.1 class I SAM-dependent methyltransferase [Streptomyces marincola]
MTLDHDPAPDADHRAVHDGQAPYHRRALAFYDLFVMHGSAPWFWRCPPRNFRQLYDTCAGARHVEIGVGTGYLLHHARFPVPDPRITLVDLNPATLDYTAKRLARYRTERVVANALEPLPLPEGEADSAALSFLLHCLPGSIADKGVALAHAARAVRPGGVVFGSTILASGVPVTRAGRFLMRELNRKGVFHNERDSLGDLRDRLDAHFPRHELVVRGCVGLFRAWTPA